MSKRKKSIKSEIENTFNDQNGLVIVGIGASAGGLEAI